MMIHHTYLHATTGNKFYLVHASVLQRERERERETHTHSVLDGSIEHACAVQQQHAAAAAETGRGAIEIND